MDDTPVMDQFSKEVWRSWSSAYYKCIYIDV